MGIFLGDPWQDMRQQGQSAPQQGGLGIGGFLRSDNGSNLLQALGASLMSSPGYAPLSNFPSLLAGYQAQSAQKRASAKEEEKANRTLEYIRSNFPDIGKMVDAGLPVSEAFKMVIDSRKGPDMTDDQREYQAAVGQGFDGTFMDYMVKMKEAGRQQVNIDTGVKLPTGYQWVDPNNQEMGVKPIEGGPATQIPAELAARVGMADNFLTQLPGIREKVAAGDVTGIWDRAKAGFGNGSENEAYRQIQSGVDSLMRMLTGAGMNQTEAEAYANRYLPTYTDSAESAASKLDQLKGELERIKDMTMRGRSAPTAPSAGGVVDYRDFFGGQ